MGYTITGTDRVGGEKSYWRDRAEDALKKVNELRESGMENIAIKDDSGKVLSEADLARLGKR